MRLGLLLVALLPFFASPGLAQSVKTKHDTTPATARPTDLNTASESELNALPGVGPATAKKIVAGRPYSSVGDLQRAGVPKATIDKIAPLVTVSGSRGAKQESETPDKDRSTEAPGRGSRIDLNSASEKELDALPGVGPATAKKIIAGRPYSTVGDLQRAGVPKATIDKIAPLVTVSGTSGSRTLHLHHYPAKLATPARRGAPRRLRFNVQHQLLPSARLAPEWSG